MPEFELKDPAEKEFQQMLFDVKYDREQFKDPETIGLLLYRLARERQAANQMFKELAAKLDNVATLLQQKPQEGRAEASKLLGYADNKIITHIQRYGKVDAEGIQKRFGYRGKNAASARLNALFLKGFLKKGRAGKKVFYWL